MTPLVHALIRLCIVEHYGSSKRVPGFLKLKMDKKFKEDLVKTYKELGWECARGMLKVRFNLI